MSDESDRAIDARKQHPTILYVDVYPYRIDPHTGGLRFLTLKRRADVQLGDTWQPASGKLRAGERISAAFARLVRDKTGQTARRLWSLDHLNTFYDSHYDTVLVVPAAAAELPDTAVALQSESHCDHAWLTSADARARLIWPDQQACISEIEDAVTAGLDTGRYRLRKLPTTA